MGRYRGVEIVILGPDGQPVPTGEVGEVVTRSSNNMLGYWNLPDATATTMTDDGWIRTGDAGYLDADGYLFIHDRMKDMIITGGENVYSKEVEDALMAAGGIADCAVIGLPHPEWGETVVAVVVPAPGAAPGVPDLQSALKGRLASYKLPRRFLTADALPRTPTGKVMKHAIRAMFAAETV